MAPNKIANEDNRHLQYENLIKFQIHTWDKIIWFGNLLYSHASSKKVYGSALNDGQKIVQNTTNRLALNRLPSAVISITKV